MEKLTIEQRYKNAKQELEALKTKAVEINTIIKVSQEEYKQAIEKMKKEFGVNTFEELRELRKAKQQENLKIVEELEETNKKLKKEIEEAEQKIEAAKNNLKETN